MNHPVLYDSVIGMAVVLLGLSKGGFAGMGALATPLMAFVVGPLRAISLMLPVMVVLDIIAIFMYHATVERGVLKILLLGAVPGIFLAYQALSCISVMDVQILLGGLSLAFAVQQLLKFFNITRPKAGEAPWRRPPGLYVSGILCGLASGFSSTVAHAGSPPFQFYVQPMKWERDLYIGTSVFFFAIVNLLKVPVFWELGQISTNILAQSLVFLPVAVLSSWVGRRLVRRVNLHVFNVMISALLAMVGVLLIVQAAFRF